MNFEHLISGTIGGIHLLASVIAMIAGGYIILAQKGTKTHRQVGWIYVIAMTILLITAFMIYTLYGKFGPFHWMAIISAVTLLLGLYPILRRTNKNYIIQHFSFMYWSVVGLYCAFAAETLVRCGTLIRTPDGKPSFIFFKLVGVAVAIVMAIAIFFWIKNKPKWVKQFGVK